MDEAVWDDPSEFRPDRWFENPDAPMFTYGLGYRSKEHISLSYVLFLTDREHVLASWLPPGYIISIKKSLLLIY